jgi:hypothetical protein
LETKARNRFSSPTSLKQLEDVLQEEWYKIPLETAKSLYESIPTRIAAVLKAKVVEHHINKETGIVSVVYLLFCPTLYVFFRTYGSRYIMKNMNRPTYYMISKFPRKFASSVRASTDTHAQALIIINVKGGSCVTERCVEAI